MQSLYSVGNLTRGTSLGCEVKRSRTFLQRLFGLSFRGGLSEGEGLWLAPCRGVHSVGMRFAFDAIYLSDSLAVVGLRESYAPFRVGPFPPGTRSVLEMKVGCIARSGTEVGDQLVCRPATGPNSSSDSQR